MKVILNIGVLIVLIQSIKWANSEDMAIRRGEFYELLLLTVFGMYLMISARHFLLFVIGLETASLPLAALVAFHKKRYESHEAAAKYMFTAIFSSAVFLMGLSFVYGLFGSLRLLQRHCIPGNEQYFGRACCCIGIRHCRVSVSSSRLFRSICGLPTFTKGHPRPSLSYLSVISKGAAAFAFMVVLVQVFGAAYSKIWEWMLYAIIVLTITLGNLFAIRQRNIKRFLAFSSISQAGYIMLGVIGGNEMGLASLMFYVLVYIFSNLAAFGVAFAIEQQSGKMSIDDYNGLYKTNPWLSFTMMLAMFSLAGIPPFAGFFSKFFIFAGALECGETSIYILVLIALINTIISLYYYLLVVKAMFISPDECGIERFRSSCGERVALIVCTFGIILTGIVSCIYTFLVEAAQDGTTMFGLLN